MGAKVRCPSCGAKNDATSRRCRVCTQVINADAPDPTTAEPGPQPASVEEHFDAGVIDRQLQPTRTKFGDDSGGLAARLAAARAAKAADQPIPTGPGLAESDAPPAAAWSDPPSSPDLDAPPSRSPAPDAPPAPAWSADAPFEPVDLSEMQARQAPPTAPPIEHEAEPFDPDALFRDMG